MAEPLNFSGEKIMTNEQYEKMSDLIIEYEWIEKEMDRMTELVQNAEEKKITLITILGKDTDEQFLVDYTTFKEMADAYLKAMSKRKNDL